jgi:hypothetical protein
VGCVLVGVVLVGGVIAGSLIARDAVGALAEDREVRAVHLEPPLAPQPLGQGPHQVRRRVRHAAAAVTHHMHVVVSSWAIHRGAVAEVRVFDQADLLEQFQRAVDGGEIDVGQRVRDLLRGGVREVVDGIEHLFALGGHPQPTGTQCRREFGRVFGSTHRHQS